MNWKNKCKCGVELFDKDIVEYIKGNSKDYIELPGKYRCPKCFKTKKVNEKSE